MLESSQLPGSTADAIGDVIDPAIAASVATTPAVQDSSAFSMFWNAGFVIKCVVILLLISSIWSWKIIISKHMRMKRLAAEADYFEDSFWSGTPLEALYQDLREAAFDPMSSVFCAAMAEWKSFVEKNTRNSDVIKIMERRIDRVMQISIRKEIDELEKSMGFLSSLGTNGVIMGLFGTVLGILNGLKAIAIQQSASLVTVAPVISEALFTTALGIVAAIPAAVAYNKLMNDINRYINRLETFSEEFSSIISRQCDEQ
ncbi:MAG: protein TolQ [Holosporales bacterium]|nr:protein TolQ [Holosporales bacterium]